LFNNVDFSETCFSQGNEVGLILYTDYMISENGYDWFHSVVTCFALKMKFFWKNDKERRTCDFDDFVKVSRFYCTHMWSKCIHSWGIGPCLVGFDLFVPIILKL